MFSAHQFAQVSSLSPRHCNRGKKPAIFRAWSTNTHRCLTASRLFAESKRSKSPGRNPGTPCISSAQRHCLPNTQCKIREPV